MRPFLKIPTLALALLALAALPAFAEPGTEGEDDIAAQIQRQMDKIIELMEKNEAALLRLSTGEKATPTPVDVRPPELPPREGDGTSGESRDRPNAGESAQKALDELIRGQRDTAGQIPGELEELVRMVPQ